jgi:hypothetical protein
MPRTFKSDAILDGYLVPLSFVRIAATAKSADFLALERRRLSLARSYRSEEC